MSNAAVEAAGPEEEVFAPSSGRWLGWAVVVVAAALVAAGAGDPARERKTIYLGVLVAAVTWVVLIRPSVSAHSNGVLLRNMSRDTFVPWSKIDRCRVLQTLQVVTEEARFHGLGVSRSARSMTKQNYGTSSIMARGLSRGLGGSALDVAGRTSQPDPSQRVKAGIAYQDYVEMRIGDRARDVKPDGLEPLVSWAWPSVVALATAAVMLVLLLT